MASARANLLSEQPQPCQVMQRQLFASHPAPQLALEHRQQRHSCPALPSYGLCAARSGGDPMRMRSGSCAYLPAARCAAPCEQKEAPRTSAYTASALRRSAGRRSPSSALAVDSRRNTSTAHSARLCKTASRIEITLRRRPVWASALRRANRGGTSLGLPARRGARALNRTGRHNRHVRDAIVAATCLATARPASRARSSSVPARGESCPALCGACVIPLQRACGHGSSPAQPLQLLDLPDEALSGVLMHVAGVCRAQGAAAPQLSAPPPEAHQHLRAATQVRTCRQCCADADVALHAREAERRNEALSRAVHARHVCRRNNTEPHVGRAVADEWPSSSFQRRLEVALTCFQCWELATPR